jgi:replicative DNA helicase
MIVKDVTERKLLSSLLNKPELVKEIEFNPNWFAHPAYRELAQAFAECQGDVEQYYDLLKIIEEHNPYTPVDIELLAAMRNESLTTAYVEKEAKLLKEEFLNNQIITAAANLTSMPNRENLSMLEYLMDVKAQEDEEEATGEIKPITDTLRERFDKDLPEGLKSYGKLDLAFHGGVRGNKLLTLAARPAVGKSAFAVNFALKILERNKGVAIDFFSLEMGDVDVLERFVMAKTGLSSIKVQRPKKTATEKEKLQLEGAYQYFDASGMRIYDNKFDVDDIIRTIRKRGRDKKDYLAIIDYIGLVGVSDKRKDTTARVSEITLKLKRLTNDLSIPILALAQLNREVKQTDQPQLSHLRDSGSIEQDSNVIMFLHEKVDDRQPGKILTQLTVAKNREGSTGIVDFIFDKPHMYFNEQM